VVPLPPAPDNDTGVLAATSHTIIVLLIAEPTAKRRPSGDHDKEETCANPGYFNTCNMADPTFKTSLFIDKNGFWPIESKLVDSLVFSNGTFHKQTPVLLMGIQYNT